LQRSNRIWTVRATEAPTVPAGRPAIELIEDDGPAKISAGVLVVKTPAGRLRFPNLRLSTVDMSRVVAKLNEEARVTAYEDASRIAQEKLDVIGRIVWRR
jgi:hypothetical protein